LRPSMAVVALLQHSGPLLLPLLCALCRLRCLAEPRSSPSCLHIRGACIGGYRNSGGDGSQAMSWWR